MVVCGNLTRAMAEQDCVARAESWARACRVGLADSGAARPALPPPQRGPGTRAGPGHQYIAIHYPGQQLYTLTWKLCFN